MNGLPPKSRLIRIRPEKYQFVLIAFFYLAAAFVRIWIFFIWRSDADAVILYVCMILYLFMLRMLWLCSFSISFLSSSLFLSIFLSLSLFHIFHYCWRIFFYSLADSCTMFRDSFFTDESDLCQAKCQHNCVHDVCM